MADNINCEDTAQSVAETNNFHNINDESPVFCIFCRKNIQYSSQVSDHLVSEHNIYHEVDFIIKKCFKLSGTKDVDTDSSQSNTASNGHSKFRDEAVQTESPLPEVEDHAEAVSSPEAVGSDSRIKIPWFAGCEYRCKICSKLYFYIEDLRDHVRRKHFSPNEYLKKFQTFETRPVMLRCKICSMPIKRNYASVWNHLNKDHGVSLIEYQEKFGMVDYDAAQNSSKNGVSDESSAPPSSDDENEASTNFRKRLNPAIFELARPQDKKPRLTIEPATGSVSTKESVGAPKKFWFVGCEYRCLLPSCTSLVLDMPDMICHLKESHEMTPRQYMERFRKMESRFHWYTCGVCQSRVKHQRSTITKHLETHSMSLIKYTEIFHPEELKALKEEKNLPASPANLPHSTSAVPSPAVKMTFERWSRGACKFRCAVCNFTSECSAEFWKHASSEHLLNIAEYKAELGNPCVVYKEIQCLGCNKLLRFDPGTLANHASHAHDMSMEDFYDAFFKAEESDSGKDEGDSKVFCDDVEKYEEEARQWSDQCVYECRICNTASYANYGSLFDHIKSKHAISVDDYKVEYGEMASKKVIHHCRVCQVEFLHTSAIMKKHLKRCHEMTLAQYYLDYIKNGSERESVPVVNEASDDAEDKVPMDEETAANYAKWKQGCEYECKVCSIVHFSWNDLSEHLKEVHDISPEDYRDQHGMLMTKKSYHKCFICRAPIIQEPKNLRLHMKKRHELFLDEYYIKYVKGGRRPPGPTHSGTSTPVVKAIETGIISFADWKYACRYDCKICGFSTRHSSDFSTHMSGKHGMSLAEYSKVYGKAMTKRVHHKCRICGNLIIQQPQSMKGHMTMHSLTLEEYFNKYISHDENADIEDQVVYTDEAARLMDAGYNMEPENVSSGEFYPMEDSNFEGEDVSLLYPEDVSVMAEGGQEASGEVTFDDWRHACVYTCKICGHSSRHHADIYSHMLSKHNMSIREYTEKYGKAMTKEVYHTCHICGKELLQQSKNIKKHIQSHDLTLEKYFEDYVKSGKMSEAVQLQRQQLMGDNMAPESVSTSNGLGKMSATKKSIPDASPNSFFARWKNACKFECKICHYATKAYFTFNFHVKDKHGLQVQDYIKKHGKPMTKKVYHRCVICGAAFLQISKTISRHLQQHGISIQNYYEQYVAGDEIPGNEVEERLTRGQRPTHPPTKRGPPKFTKEQRISKCLSKSPYLTFCWNQCKETCGICKQVFSTSATLHKHVRFVHNVGLEWYRSNHVTSIDDVSTVCLICNASVQLTQKAMETHLRSAHSMALMNYEEQFKDELSQQFEQLQTMRQSNINSEDDVGRDEVTMEQTESENPLAIGGESGHFLASMLKTDLQVEGDEEAAPDEEFCDERLEGEDEMDDGDQGQDAMNFFEPEQMMMEGE